MKFSAAVMVNPRINIKKGEKYSFVDMQSLTPNNKFVKGSEERVFNGGGSKFENGDTLMARITPCLENGKIAQYKRNGGQPIAHGSTEFIVFRGRKGVSDNEYVYYLTRSDEVRNYAIGQMTGTSGRQRVPVDCFDHLEIELPPVNEQKAIAKILSDLDAKIDLNRRMNETLEQMARAIFKQWFMDFEFPGYEKTKFVDGLPEGWREEKLGDFADILNGFAFKSEDFVRSGIFLLRTRNFADNGYIVRDDTACLPQIFYDQYKNFRLRKFDVLLVMVGASVGKMAMVQSSVLPALQNQNMWNFRAKIEGGQLFLYFLVKKIVQENIGTASGSARDFFRKDYFRNIDFIVPSEAILKDFDKQVRTMFEQIDKNLQEMEILTKIRDTLLPKLMSGEIRVK